MAEHEDMVVTLLEWLANFGRARNADQCDIICECEEKPNLLCCPFFFRPFHTDFVTPSVRRVAATTAMPSDDANCA